MRRLVPVLFAFIAAASLAGAPPGDATQPAAEWKANSGVISQQLAALKARDGARAMAYAVPDLRAQFGTPDRFLRMVRQSYSALLDARSTTFLTGAIVDGVTIQPLQLVLPDNSVEVALYQMRKQKDGRWRIAGCVLAPSTVQAI